MRREAVRISLGTMAREALWAFCRAAEVAGVEPPQDAGASAGWEACALEASVLADEGASVTLAELGKALCTAYLRGAGLPADHLLADPAWARGWRAAAVALHRLAVGEADDARQAREAVEYHLEGGG